MKAAEATGPGLHFTVRLSRDVIERAVAARKLVPTYASNRLADCLRAEGLAPPWLLWFVLELDAGDGLDGLHMHGGALVHDRERAALGRALRRLAGGFDGPAGRFAVKVGAFDPLRRFAGRHGAPGWAAYAMKDYAAKGGRARARGRLGRSPVYVSRSLSRHVREMHEAADRRTGPAYAAERPCQAPSGPRGGSAQVSESPARRVTVPYGPRRRREATRGDGCMACRSTTPATTRPTSALTMGAASGTTASRRARDGERGPGGPA